MFFERLRAVIASALVATVSSPIIAKANECGRLIAEYQNIEQDSSKEGDLLLAARDKITASPTHNHHDTLVQLQKSSSLGCEFSKHQLKQIHELIEHRKTLESVCRKKELYQACGSACWENWLPAAEKAVRNDCAEAEKFAAQLRAESGQVDHKSRQPAEMPSPDQGLGCNPGTQDVGGCVNVHPAAPAPPRIALPSPPAARHTGQVGSGRLAPPPLPPPQKLATGNGTKQPAKSHMPPPSLPAARVTGSRSANAAAAPSCQGEMTSNGCVQPYRPAPRPPINVVIGKPVPPAPPPTRVGSNGTAGDARNIPTPCQDLTGVYGCRNGGGTSILRSPWVANGRTKTLARPRPPQLIRTTIPDVQNQIVRLADQIDGMAPNDPARPPAVRHLRRLVSENEPAVDSYQLACLDQTTGADPRAADLVLLWKPEHINNEGMKYSGLCQGIKNDAELEACHEKNYGLVVMHVEPELAGQCRGAGGPDHDIDKMAECAKNKFLNAWLFRGGFVPAPPPNTWTTAKMYCNPPNVGKKKSLRDIINDYLAHHPPVDPKGHHGPGGSNDTPAASEVGNGVQADAPPAEETKQGPRDDDEAYCSYVALEAVRGELSPGGGTPIPAGCKAAIAAAEALKAHQHLPFTMSDVETDKAIAGLIQHVEALQSPDGAAQ